jgi:hypothetical protein
MRCFDGRAAAHRGLGLSLALVGVLPLSYNVFAHERAAKRSLRGAAAHASPAPARGVPHLDRLAVGRRRAAVGMTALVAGVITLTVFEALAFGSVIAWLHTLETRVRRPPRRAAPIHGKLSAFDLVPHLGDKVIRCYCRDLS